MATRLAEFKDRFEIELAGLSQVEQEGCEALLTSLAYLQDAGRHVDADLIVAGLARRSQRGERQLALEEVRSLQSLIADHFSGATASERGDITPEGFPSGRFSQQQGGFSRLDEQMGSLARDVERLAGIPNGYRGPLRNQLDQVGHS